MRNAVWRYLWAVLGVVAATAIYWPIDGFMAKGHDPSLLFLPVVIACAVRLGFGPAVLASILGFLVWDYLFVAPRFTLVVNEPRDYLALGVFLLTGITTARLAAQVRRKAEEAEARGREISTLFRISQIVSSEFNPDRVLTTLAEQIANACDASRCIVFRTGDSFQLAAAASADAGTHSGPDLNASMLRLAQRALETDQILGLAEVDATWSIAAESAAENELPAASDSTLGAFIPLHIHNSRVGVLHVGPRRDARNRTVQERNLVIALGNYTAAVIARANLADASQETLRTAAVTEERDRLTREIHDTVAQSLTGIVIQLQAAEGLQPEQQAGAIVQARDLAQECLAEARRSVRALRPGALVGSDLPTALQALIDRADRPNRGGADATFETAGFRRPLPFRVEEQLYRIAQEAFANARRHSGATAIQVALNYASDSVRLSVCDDGAGIDLLQSAEFGFGFGLTSMRERAEMLGAKLCIEPGPRGGTQVSVVVALKARPPADPPISGEEKR